MKSIRKALALSGNIWTPEKVAELTRLMLTCGAAGDIAARMGISRNAVIGKINRMRRAEAGLPAKPHRKTPRPAKRAAERPARPRRPMALAIGMMDLQADSCRFPLNDDPKAMLFCGRQADPEGSYCTEHHARCYDGLTREPKTKPQGRGKLGYFDG